MQVKLKVTKIVATDASVVAKLEPSLVDARAGDEVSGELFLTTAPDLAVLGLGDEITIDFIKEEEETQPVEG